jgi:hypothetical protein
MLDALGILPQRKQHKKLLQVNCRYIFPLNFGKCGGITFFLFLFITDK